MSRVLMVVLALAVLAISQAVVAALALALAVMLLFHMVTRPRETLAFVGTLLVFGLATARPVAFIVTAGVVAFAVVIAGARRKAGHQLFSQTNGKGFNVGRVKTPTVKYFPNGSADGPI